jgi:tellurite resistance protein TerC
VVVLTLSVPFWAWVAVVAAILAMLAVDLAAHRREHVVRPREALAWSGAWIALGLAFGFVVWATWGGEAGGEYLAGYLVEKALAVDNVFVIALLFTALAVPRGAQHRVLFYGVVGALVLRALFIAAGTVVIEHAHWVFYLFGVFLVYTGVKMARHHTIEVHPERNPVLRLLRRVAPVTTDYHGSRFLLRRDGAWVATPLLAALVAVETTDVVFAVDSIPAVFAVTEEPFLVFTSNAFAVLGMRALYFLLADAMGRFGYLRYGLAAVLLFVGAKMLVADLYHVPVWLSLAVILAALAASIGASMWRGRGPGRPGPAGSGGPPESRRSGSDADATQPSPVAQAGDTRRGSSGAG